MYYNNQQNSNIKERRSKKHVLNNESQFFKYMYI